jgi:hypothetical protein
MNYHLKIIYHSLIKKYIDNIIFKVENVINTSLISCTNINRYNKRYKTTTSTINLNRNSNISVCSLNKIHKKSFTASAKIDLNTNSLIDNPKVS